jgi:hypothetical protein
MPHVCIPFYATDSIVTLDGKIPLDLALPLMYVQLFALSWF